MGPLELLKILDILLDIQIVIIFIIGIYEIFGGK